MSLYGLYKNNRLVMMGTAMEIAKHEDITIKSVYYYTTPTYEKRRSSYDAKKVVKINMKELKLSNDIDTIVKLYFKGFKLKEALEIIKGRNEIDQQQELLS